MLKTLYSKLVAVLLVLFCIIGAFFLLSILTTNRLYQQEVRQKLNYSLADHIASRNALLAEGRVNDRALEGIFSMLMAVNPDIELYLLDTEGTILSYSAPPGKVKRHDVSIEPIVAFLKGGKPFPIRGDDPRDPYRKKVFSAAPVRSGDRTEGYLYVILGGEKYDSVAQMLQGSYIMRTSVFIGGVSLLFALFAGLMFFKQLTRRLGRLTAAMDDFKGRNFYEIPGELDWFRKDGGDEIDKLGLAFANMAVMIRTQMTALKQSDTHRRELVSSISHDLRTPLSSLRAYLETLMLREDSLSPDDKRQYLSTAILHCDRLGILISELFELSKLDSPDLKLDIEPFSLAELVSDIIQKFHITAEEKRISIRTVLQGEIPFVLADIGMIERVLDNLIENALRFSSEHDTVTVSLIPGGSSVSVTVADTGCGISEEDLPFIFDRFYQGKRSNGERHDGSGIGLSIAKRIVELHESELEVESTPGSGTIFTFFLPAKSEEYS